MGKSTVRKIVKHVNELEQLWQHNLILQARDTFTLNFEKINEKWHASV
jgi:hypothetical protein